MIETGREEKRERDRQTEGEEVKETERGKNRDRWRKETKMRRWWSVRILASPLCSGHSLTPHTLGILKSTWPFFTLMPQSPEMERLRVTWCPKLQKFQSHENHMHTRTHTHPPTHPLTHTSQPFTRAIHYFQPLLFSHSVAGTVKIKRDDFTGGEWFCLVCHHGMACGCSLGQLLILGEKKP